MILFLLTLLTLLLFYNFRYKRQHLPPGPTPWPIMGNVFEMGRSPSWNRLFYEWKVRYGGIYTYWLGETPIVNVCDYRLAVELAVKNADAYADRVQLPHSDFAMRGGILGIVSTNDEMWREHRRFVMKVLRDFGMGKNKIQEHILDQVRYLTSEIDEKVIKKDGVTDLHDVVSVAVGSIINSLLFGYDFRGREHECHRTTQLMQGLVEGLSRPLAVIGRFYPLSLHIPAVKRRFDEVAHTFHLLLHDMTVIVEEHRERYIMEGEEMKVLDFVDAYLVEQGKLMRDEGNVGLFSNDQLVNVLIDVWFGGHETSHATILWGIAFWIHNPQIQERMHKELDTVINGDRMVTLADKLSLPYMNATISEIQRFANIFRQFNLAHALAKDVEIGDYHFRRGQVLNIEFCAWFKDPEVFENPDVFDPNRFLDENGQFRKCDELIPFGIGRRVCLGESLARTELFLILANLANQYKFLPHEDLPKLEPYLNPNATILPPFECKIVKRHKDSPATV